MEDTIIPATLGCKINEFLIKNYVLARSMTKYHFGPPDTFLEAIIFQRFYFEMA